MSREVTTEEYFAMLDECMTEEQHQIRLFKELDLLALQNPDYGDIHHIPNGGHRHKATAGKLKAMGVKTGIPDIFIPHARRGFYGMYIELKSAKKGSKLSYAQIKRGKRLAKNGYAVLCCAGWREALKTIKDYLERDNVRN